MDELNRTTGYAYDGYGRLMQVTRPEGDTTQYAYDGRGNVTKSTATPKTGFSAPNIVTQASYDSSCANIVKCNKPNSTLDALNNETDYVYDPTHGGPTSITSPAGVNGIRPQLRFGYTAYGTSNGSVYRLTSTSTASFLRAPARLGRKVGPAASTLSVRLELAPIHRDRQITAAEQPSTESISTAAPQTLPAVRLRVALSLTVGFYSGYNRRVAWPILRYQRTATLT